MIDKNKEFFSAPYYFFLKETNNKYYLYFSIANTLNEARQKDDVVSFVREKEQDVKKFLKNLLKSKKPPAQKEVKDELEELVNLDGAIGNLKTPILDPRLHPKKTMDQTVAAATITNDPLRRGYRTYFRESEIDETDMSDAFGYEETKDLDGKETFKFFVKNLEMEPDEAKKRTKQQGKDPSGKKDEKSKYKYKKVITKRGKIKKVKDPNFITRATLSEIQKQKMIKVLEDILVNKKSKDSDISDKEPKKASNIVKKNINTLKKQAEKDGISVGELIKMLKSE
jgi:hypothetical protein